MESFKENTENQKENPFEERGLLRRVGEIEVMPVIVNFVPSDRFVVDSRTRTGVRIAEIYPKLSERRWDEGADASSSIDYFDITEQFDSSEIKSTLGNHLNINLSQVFRLLKEQNQGQEGPLLTNGSWNIFFVNSTIVKVKWNTEARTYQFMNQRIRTPIGWIIEPGAKDFLLNDNMRLFSPKP